METNINLMISAELLSKLKRKHRKKLVDLGFWPRNFFDYSFFHTYSIIETVGSENFTISTPVISYLYSEQGLSDEVKEELKLVYTELYKCGILPIKLNKKDLFITRDGTLTLFITSGLVSSSYGSKKVYNDEKILKNLDKFIDSL